MTPPNDVSIPLAENATIAHAESSAPLWYKDAIIYQLHVKAFFDANDDGIGDFEGLRHSSITCRISGSRRYGCCRFTPRRCATTVTTSPITERSTHHMAECMIFECLCERHTAAISE